MEEQVWERRQHHYHVRIATFHFFSHRRMSFGAIVSGPAPCSGPVVTTRRTYSSSSPPVRCSPSDEGGGEGKGME